ncbi:MAG: hypothetical protein LBR80_03315 [Deltaproteobacteria bacterium]|nr:hypothetical protein [Deltaproteobacteria bacterium]
MSLGQGSGFFLCEGGSAGTLFARSPFPRLGHEGLESAERTPVLPSGRAKRNLGRWSFPAGGIRFDPSPDSEDREAILRLVGPTAAGSAAGVQAGKASPKPAGPERSERPGKSASGGAGYPHGYPS